MSDVKVRWRLLTWIGISSWKSGAVDVQRFLGSSTVGWGRFLERLFQVGRNNSSVGNAACVRVHLTVKVHGYDWKVGEV